VAGYEKVDADGYRKKAPDDHSGATLVQQYRFEFGTNHSDYPHRRFLLIFSALADAGKNCQPRATHHRRR
jgi:hypothetical protein